ncbi:MAG: hypothetical protein R3214_10100 [Christiangramia sp.]|nr:hypothetical protein [Christiangramia sp.]
MKEKKLIGIRIIVRIQLSQQMAGCMANTVKIGFALYAVVFVKPKSLINTYLL